MSAESKKTRAGHGQKAWLELRPAKQSLFKALNEQGSMQTSGTGIGLRLKAASTTPKLIRNMRIDASDTVVFRRWTTECRGHEQSPGLNLRNWQQLALPPGEN
ncbi:hypothetical protein ACIQAL_30745 [Pseudomonas sp. NPDC088368]|uniref:hypothetical protein n=1 Tax=Pseudomonas sp. NPDC088368 TaxID=3364453 RepID=UPI0037FA6678